MENRSVIIGRVDFLYLDVLVSNYPTWVKGVVFCSDKGLGVVHAQSLEPGHLEGVRTS